MEPPEPKMNLSPITKDPAGTVLATILNDLNDPKLANRVVSIINCFREKIDAVFNSNLTVPLKREIIEWLTKDATRKVDAHDRWPLIVRTHANCIIAGCSRKLIKSTYKDPSRPQDEKPYKTKRQQELEIDRHWQE